MSHLSAVLKKLWGIKNVKLSFRLHDLIKFLKVTVHKKSCDSEEVSREALTEFFPSEQVLLSHGDFSFHNIFQAIQIKSHCRKLVESFSLN